MPDYAVQRRTMVDRQVRTFDVVDHRVIMAMEAVPREPFLPVSQRPFAYSDAEVVVKPPLPGRDPGRELMTPAAFARLLQLATIRPDEIVLDVGCATGYSAAVLARLANSVVALEADADLAAAAMTTLIDLGVDNAAVVTHPLHEGYPSEAPYDVIVLEGAVEEVPDALLRQLKDGGRLVAIVGHGLAASGRLFTRTGDEFGDRAAFNAPAPPLPGFQRRPAFAF